MKIKSLILFAAAVAALTSCDKSDIEAPAGQTNVVSYKVEAKEFEDREVTYGVGENVFTMCSHAMNGASGIGFEGYVPVKFSLLVHTEKPLRKVLSRGRVLRVGERDARIELGPLTLRKGGSDEVIFPESAEITAGHVSFDSFAERSTGEPRFTGTFEFTLSVTVNQSRPYDPSASETVEVKITDGMFWRKYLKR